MITNRFVSIGSYEEFKTKKIAANKENTTYTMGDTGSPITGEPDISYQSIIFIRDVQKIYTHSEMFGGGDVDAMTEAEIDAIFTDESDGDITSEVQALGTKVEAGIQYYNTTSGKTISDITGFSVFARESVISSTYPITFSGSKIKVAQYMNYLVTESGTYIYSLRYVPISASDYIIAVNCSIYE